MASIGESESQLVEAPTPTEPGAEPAAPSFGGGGDAFLKGQCEVKDCKTTVFRTSTSKFLGAMIGVYKGIN